MNKERPSRKARRSYDNSLRLEQARQTRERILDSAVRVVQSGGWKGVSLATVARAAGVSEPTLYRHFGSRERLLEELEAHATAKLGFPGFPENEEQLVRHVDQLFAKFEEHAPLMRASKEGGFGREVRARGRAGRTRRMRSLVEALSPHLDGPEIERLTGVVRLLLSWEAFDTLTREVGLSSQDASEAVSWALQTLIDNPRSGARGGNGGARSKTKRTARTSPAKERRA